MTCNYQKNDSLASGLINQSYVVMKDDSPSRRTTSPLTSDYQSEAVGLAVIINRTGREYSMILKKSLPSSLIASQMPMYKGLRAGEGDSFTLPSPSLIWRFSLTLINHAEYLGLVRIREWKRERDGRSQETHSLAVSPVFKGVSSKKGSKGG